MVLMPDTVNITTTMLKVNCRIKVLNRVFCHRRHYQDEFTISESPFDFAAYSHICSLCGNHRKTYAILSAMKSRIPLVSSVLHPTDFSDASNKAFAHALAIALLRQTELTILHVGAEYRDNVAWSSYPQVRQTLERWKLLEPGSPRSAVYEELDVEVRKVAVRSRNPIRATSQLLDHQPHDLVVLATEGAEGRENWLYRSEAEAIARGSNAMTLFVPSRSHHGFVSLEDGDLNLKNVLIPVDAAIDFTAAIEFSRRAADIIGDGDVVITLLHVGEQMPSIPELSEGPGWTWHTSLRHGEPVESILDAMDDLDADLIVMTTNGRDTLRQALAGSTTERIIRKADCPVLAVPDGKYQTAD
jgi:nucleotide-binding universal stress UspA family protein